MNLNIQKQTVDYFSNYARQISCWLYNCQAFSCWLYSCKAFSCWIYSCQNFSCWLYTVARIFLADYPVLPTQNSHSLFQRQTIEHNRAAWISWNEEGLYSTIRNGESLCGYLKERPEKIALKWIIIYGPAFMSYRRRRIRRTNSSTISKI